MPATFVSLLPSTFCEVSFILKVDMVRKGFLRRHETIRIPISYFPKTRPSHPSVMEVPWPLASPNENPFDDDTTVKCTALQEYDPITRATITRKSTESIYVRTIPPDNQDFITDIYLCLACHSRTNKFHIRRGHPVYTQFQISSGTNSPTALDT